MSSKDMKLAKEAGRDGQTSFAAFMAFVLPRISPRMALANAELSGSRLQLFDPTSSALSASP